MTSKEYEEKTGEILTPCWDYCRCFEICEFTGLPCELGLAGMKQIGDPIPVPEITNHLSQENENGNNKN